MGPSNFLLRLVIATVLTSMVVFSSGCSSGRPAYPVTEKKPVTDEYYGNTVVDEYRWLDDLADPQVRRWNDAQNSFSRSILDGIPSRATVYDRISTIRSDKSSDYFSLMYRGRLFAMKQQPPRNHPFLVLLASADSVTDEKIVVDPNQLDAQGTTSIDFFVPSLDGRLVAVALSKNGSEDGSVYIFDVESGKQLDDVVPRAQYATAGGSVAWNKDATGFYYTRYPQGNERPPEDRNFFQQVYYHKRGTSSSEDSYVIGKEFPRIAEIRLASNSDGYLLVTVANGDGGEFAHHLMNPKGRWVQITQFADEVKAAELGKDGRLYLLSKNNAPRGRVLSVPLQNPVLSGATVVVPESDATIEEFLQTPGKLYVEEQVGGPSRIRAFALDGRFLQAIPTPPVASVGGMVNMVGDEVLFGQESYLEPFAYYRYDPATGLTQRTALASRSIVNFNDCEVVREFATSKDSTRVPINIIMRKGTILDGNNPTILYGYGGYGIDMTPEFSPTRRVWLEQGGVFVIANLRGGGEFGEEWHNAGRLTRKQNVFDDFTACAKHLIERKYTSAEKLAFEGGSNGGLLMGAALTQEPGLSRAVVSYVGIYDMLRVELFPNGAFNVTEFGSVKDPDQFKALYAYSPYHHVVDGQKYPAVLMITGDNDGRVDPANSRKMVARLQAASGSPWPIMLRTSSSSGHGIGTGLSERIAEDADVYAFLFDRLQVKVQPVRQ